MCQISIFEVSFKDVTCCYRLVVPLMLQGILNLCKFFIEKSCSNLHSAFALGDSWWRSKISFLVQLRKDVFRLNNKVSSVDSLGQLLLNTLIFMIVIWEHPVGLNVIIKLSFGILSQVIFFWELFETDLGSYSLALEVSLKLHTVARFRPQFEVFMFGFSWRICVQKCLQSFSLI